MRGAMWWVRSAAWREVVRRAHQGRVVALHLKQQPAITARRVGHCQPRGAVCVCQVGSPLLFRETSRGARSLRVPSCGGVPGFMQRDWRGRPGPVLESRLGTGRRSAAPAESVRDEVASRCQKNPLGGRGGAYDLCRRSIRAVTATRQGPSRGAYASASRARYQWGRASRANAECFPTREEDLHGHHSGRERDHG